MTKILIIGAGPAGTACAATLKQSGFQPKLFDARDFPRKKLCGGLITPKCKQNLETIFPTFSLRDHAEAKTKLFRFFKRQKLLKTLEYHQNFYLVNRSHFDHELVKQTQQLGVEVYLKKRVTKIDFKNQIVYFQNGKSEPYDILIGADGINSFVARSLFGTSFDRHHVAFAFEGDYQAPINSSCDLYFDYMNWGYAWSFPKSNKLTMGAGGLPHKNKFLKSQFGYFIDDCGSSKTHVDGAYFPYGSPSHPPGKFNTLLIGDAAGLADAITGEGIGYAIESGIIAAQTIQNSPLQHQVFESYQKNLRPITDDIKISFRLRKLIFHPFLKPLFFLMFKYSKRTVMAYYHVLAGHKTYSELVNEIFVNLGRKLFFLKKTKV